MKIHIPAFKAMAKRNEHLDHEAFDIDLGEDVVKVVRCCQCKYGEKDADSNYYRCTFHGADWNHASHYCGYGEVKEENEQTDL